MRAGCDVRNDIVPSVSHRRRERAFIAVRFGARLPRRELLIGLMAFRPQGLFGKREEMVLGE